MRALPLHTKDDHGDESASALGPPPEVVATSVSLVVECALASGTLEMEALAVCLEHASQVRDFTQRVILCRQQKEIM